MPKYVTVDFERCKGCELCIAICPNNLFRLGKSKNEHGYKVIEMIDKEYCLGAECLSCIKICPDNALIKPDEKTGRVQGAIYWLGNKIEKMRIERTKTK